MTVTDRALYLLQHFGIKMSEKEYIGLRLTDGMYEEANKSYYVSYSPGTVVENQYCLYITSGRHDGDSH